MLKKTISIALLAVLIIAGTISFGEDSATPDPRISMNSYPIEMTLK